MTPHAPAPFELATSYLEDLRGLYQRWEGAAVPAPEVLVQQVIDRLKVLGAISVRSMDGLTETVKFPLPKGLKLD